MKKLRIGVIGLGDICDVYLKTLLANNDKVSVEACASRGLEKAQKAAARYGIPKAYESAEQLIADPEIDMLLNLTPPAAHGKYNLMALGAGKHVYTEKPLAATYAEGREIMSLAAEKGLTAGCAPDTFLGGRIQAMRDLIDDGTIGSVTGAAGFAAYFGVESFHPNPAAFYQPGAGPLFDIGPYYMTALLSLLGPVRRCCAMSKRTFDTRTVTSEPRRGEIIPVNVDTYTTGILEFASGALATLLFSFDVRDSELPRMEIYGTKGTLCIPDIDPLDGPNLFGGELWLRTAESYRWNTLPRSAGAAASPWEKVPVTRPHTSTSHAENSCGIGLLDAVDAIREGRAPRASGEMALHSLEVMESMLVSAQEGRFCELETTFERPQPLPRPKA